MIWWNVGRVLALLSSILALLTAPESVHAQGAAPALPTTYVDTTIVAPTGRTIDVRAGQDLQAALNGARPGDVVSVEAGATFTGNFTLPKKEGSGWITVRSSAPDTSLPAPGTRVTPAQAGFMPRLVSPNSMPTLTAAPGAQGYRLTGIDFTVSPSVQTIFSILALGGDQASLADTPRNLIVDRSYVHGQPQTNTFRGILLNSANSAVVDSYVSEIHVAGFDSQAILGFNGPGPFKIVNNYLEASGENIMFGGADPKAKQLLPSDIEIRKNYLFKPLSWKADDPSFLGRQWTVKNLLELKNAQRVLVDGNLLENSWPQAQTGFAVLFTPRNQQGSAPWSVVQDVTFTNNRIRNAAGGISMLGFDDAQPSEQLKRILVRNNVWEGRLWNFVVMGGPIDGLTLDHNTALRVTNAAIIAYGGPSPNFVLTNNLLGFGQYGIIGDGVGDGIAALSSYYPGARVERNLLVGPGDRNRPSNLPPFNFTERELESLGLVDLAGDPRLGPLSRYLIAGTDGTAIGVDFDALMRDLLAGEVPLHGSTPFPGGQHALDPLLSDHHRIHMSSSSCTPGEIQDCLSPVPEPATLVLFGITLAGVGAAVLRRRLKARRGSAS